MCCWGGSLADKLKSHGFNVKCSDIINRGYPGTEIVDFLNQKIKFDGDIITNPPYRYCTEFVLNSLEAINPGNKVAMFLKIQTLEGQERYNKIYSKYPPKQYMYTLKEKYALKTEILKI